MRISFSIFFLSIFFFQPNVVQAQAVDAVEWLDNYPEALQTAKRTGKPIFLEFRCEP